MIGIAAIAACLVLAALAMFQGLLVAGAPLGRFAWGGRHDVLPTPLRVGSTVSIALYAAFAAVIIERAGLLILIDSVTFVQVTTWVLFGYFTLGILMNGISRSKPERNTMTPVSLLLAVLLLIVALG